MARSTSYTSVFGYLTQPLQQLVMYRSCPYSFCLAFLTLPFSSSSLPLHLIQPSLSSSLFTLISTCRFCLASYLTLPFRAAPLEGSLIPTIERGLSVTDRIGLLGECACYYRWCVRNADVM